MTLEKQIAEDYGMVLKEAQSMGCNKINALYNISLDNMKAIVNALEEVQKYREIGTVEECKNSVLKILEAYNKAIDDFKEELFKNSERVRPVGWLGYSEVVTCEKIYEITEQLKGGDVE